jgi:phosphoribosyl 1,2-cyclic phosphodiesterase
MSLYISSLNSGSNGNCYYVGNNTDAVLIDAGISCREVEKRMELTGLSMSKVKAVLVTHEHNDHIKGVQMLSKKYNLPIYVTEPTRRGGHIKLDKNLSKTFNTTEPITVGSLTVTAFSKQHDAVDPHSFLVSCNQVTVGVFTDIGIACNNLIHHFAQCQAAFLEANYDVNMLANGNYPYYLKQRVAGPQGHLSNDDAFMLFNEHRAANLSHLILSHISKNNNCPKLVTNLFAPAANGVEIVIASRYEPSPVYYVAGGNVNGTGSSTTVKKPLPIAQQLNFGF